MYQNMYKIKGCNYFCKIPYELTNRNTVFVVTFSSSTETMLFCVALAAVCFMRSETDVRFWDWVWQKCSGDGPGKGWALGTWSDRINGKQLDDKSVTVRRLRPFPAEGRESEWGDKLRLKSELNTRSERLCWWSCSVQYLCACDCVFCLTPIVTTMHDY